MTEVDFHFNTPERLGYACRLLRKAMRTGTGIAVTGSAGTLDELDRLLWRFDEVEFLPHVRLGQGEVKTSLRRSPVWLVDHAEKAAHLPVLVNLGEAPAEGFGSFPRLIEVVSTDAQERDAARLRWRHYASRGYRITRHEVGTG